MRRIAGILGFFAVFTFNLAVLAEDVKEAGQQSEEAENGEVGDKVEEEKQQEVAEKERDVYFLDEVIIVIHPEQDPVSVMPEVTVIDVDSFEKAGPLYTIRDVLSEVGAIDSSQISIAPGPQDDISIRGMDQWRFMVYIDGRPMRLYGAYGFYKLDFTTMSLDDVETIEIVRGSHSVLFPHSMGGAINIITKKGKKTKDLLPEAVVEGGYGNFNSYRVRAAVNGGAFERVGYSFSSSWLESDGYLRNNYTKSLNLRGRVSLYLPADARLTLGLGMIDYETGFPVINDPDRLDYDPDYPVIGDSADRYRHLPKNVYPDGDSYWDKTTYDLDAILEMPLGPGKLRTQVYHNTSTRTTAMYFYKQGEMVQADPFERTELNHGAILEYRDIKIISKNSFTIGVDWLGQGDNEDHKDQFKILSAYLQDVFKPLEQLHLVMGLRYYHNEMHAYLSKASTGIEDYEERGYTKKEDIICPKVRADYFITPSLDVYGAFSREYRIPCI